MRRACFETALPAEQAEAMGCAVSTAGTGNLYAAATIGQLESDQEQEHHYALTMMLGVEGRMARMTRSDR